VVRIGVSRCLLGDEVRYDGQHKRSQMVVDELAQRFELIGICPELEIGMSIPREPIQLVATNADGLRSPLLQAPGSGRDWTDAMRAFSRERIELMKHQRLCGIVLQQKSPSCGLGSTKVHDGHGKWQRVGTGIFAAELAKWIPQFPMMEEADLWNAAKYERFIERVLTYSRTAD
jgi:uncharacterized protein YbbK (DUF523 family)